MIWKLLRQHMSISQMVGFTLANLLGMIVVMLSIQFYNDVLPVFTEGDSFMKKDYIIVSKKVNTLGSLLMKGKGGFSASEIEEVREQDFVEQLGEFTMAQFKVSGEIGFKGVNMSTAMFFESVPDEFVDVNLDKWKFLPESELIPIIIPKSYLNMYNFGFAQSRNMPQLTEGLIGLITIKIRMYGNGTSKTMNGRIVGFSNRLNTILVPDAFMTWANTEMGNAGTKRPARLIMEVDNPANDNIARYIQDKGYEIEDNKLDAGKTVWFLKMIVGIVLAVGLLISLLSFYILMLSIYLLLQKNTTKIENLLLMGHSLERVALPYQLLTIGLNLLVLIVGVVTVLLLRGYYLDVMSEIAGAEGGSTIWPTLMAGLLLFVVVSAINVLAIRKKIGNCFFLR